MNPGATILHVPAGVGIDQSIRAEHLQPGVANLYTENVRITRRGSLAHRYGFTALSSALVGSGSRTAGLRLASYRDSIAVSTGDALHVWSPSMSQWAQRGRLPGCDARLSKVASTSLPSGKEHLVDIAYATGYYILVSAETNDATAGYSFPLVRIIDSTTKKLVKSFNLTETAAGQIVLDIKAAVIGTNLVVAYSVGADIFAQRMSLAAIESGFAAAITLASNYAASGVMALHALSDRMVLGYHNTVGSTTRITLKTFNHAADALTVLVSQNETTLSSAITGMSLGGTEELWTAWAQLTSSGIRISARHATTLASVIATTSALTMDDLGPTFVAVGRTGTSEVHLASGSFDASFAGWMYSKTIRLTNSAGSLVSDRQLDLINGWIPVSTPFAVSGRTYLEMAYDDTDGDIRNVVLVDVTADASTTGVDRNETARPVAWLAPRANMVNTLAATTRHVATDGASLFISAHLVRASAVTTSICLASYDFASALKHLPLVYGDNLYLSGGMLYQFDGEQAYENGFIVPPRIVVTAGGTGLTGTYSYTAIDEYTDAVGNVIWGPPAPVKTVTLTDEGTTVDIRRPSVTWKEGYDGSTDLPPQGLRRTKTKIYRTLATGVGDFYLLQTLQYNPALGVATVIDTAADATISSNAKLYKTPGIAGTSKDRQAVGSVRGFTECNGVLVVIDGDGSTLRAFAERTVGEAAWHHDTLQVPIDGDGDIIAVTSMDGAVIAFKRDAIFIVPVEPASANVAVGGFGSPRRIAVDVGCIDPRSVVVTGMGIFFQSDRGIELLNRSLSVEFVGEKIQATFESYPNVTAAVLDARNGLVRFSLAQTGSSTVGIDAIYDLTLQVWATFDNKRGAATSAQAVSAAYGLLGGSYRYVWLDSVGTVRYEDFTTYLDGGSWVTAKWEPAWLKTEFQREHQMWQAVSLHERKSACGLTAEVAYDWAAYDAANNKVWTEALITTYTRQVEHKITGRRQSVKFRMQDTTPAVLGTGQGLEFIGLSLDLAPHQGPTQGTPRLAVAARK